MTSTSWSIRTSGRSSVAFATAYSMIRSANSWRALSRAFRSRRLLDLGPQLGEVVEVAHRPDEVVVEVGQDLLAELAQLDLEVGLLAGQRLLAVVVREGDVEALRVADVEPDEVVLEARDQAVLADDQRHPLGRAALERRAVAGALVLDDRVVALLRSAVLDRGEGRVLVAELLDDLVDLGRRRSSRSRAGS